MVGLTTATGGDEHSDEIDGSGILFWSQLIRH